MSKFMDYWTKRQEITLRPIERLGYCRGCDKPMPPKEEVVATYSLRNRGQWIYFCLGCAKKIGELAR